MTLAEAILKVRERYGNAVTDTEITLLAIAWLEDQPLRAGTDAHDAAILVRARVLADSRVPGREALARARTEADPEQTTLDDAWRLGGLRAAFVDPYAEKSDFPPSGVGAFPHLPLAGWECPCGREKPRPGQNTIPVVTVVSLTQPECPHCGRPFREEYRVSGAAAQRVQLPWPPAERAPARRRREPTPTIETSFSTEEEA